MKKSSSDLVQFRKSREYGEGRWLNTPRERCLGLSASSQACTIDHSSIYNSVSHLRRSRGRSIKLTSQNADQFNFFNTTTKMADTRYGYLRFVFSHFLLSMRLGRCIFWPTLQWWHIASYDWTGRRVILYDREISGQGVDSTMMKRSSDTEHMRSYCRHPTTHFNLQNVLGARRDA